jgi:nucleolin
MRPPLLFSEADRVSFNAPYRVTRLFCGNLNKKVTEEELKTRLPGIMFIKWITDKQTGEFYGSSFLEMKDPASAALAVLADKTKFLGR